MSDGAAEKMDDYAIQLRASQKGFTLIVEELGVVVTERSLDAAYGRLTQRLGEIRNEFAEAGALEQLPMPRRKQAAIGAASMRPFFVKYAVVLVTILCGLAALPSVAEVVIERQLSGAVAALTSAMQSEAQKLYATSLDQLASAVKGTATDFAAKGTQVTPERLEQLRQTTHVLVTRSLPILAELAPAYQAVTGNDACAASAPNK